MGFLAYHEGEFGLGVFDHILAAILTINLLDARHRKKYAFNILLGITGAALLFMYAFLTGGVNQSGFVWYFTFPLLACYLLGARRGAAASLMILVPVLFLFLLENPPPFLAEYNAHFKWRFIPAYLLVIAFSLLFEYSREVSRRDLRRAHDELEKRVVERTAQLSEANVELRKEITERKRAEFALREAQKQLEEQLEELKKLDRMKDGLIRDVSHELKTPVAKHLMQLELLKELMVKCEHAAEAERILGVMEASIKRQQSIISNILTLSRLEKGGRALRLAELRVDRIVENVISDYQHIIDAYGIEVDLDLMRVIMRSDGEMLWQVLSNLVGNAIKYRKADGPSLIRISMEEKDRALQIRVEDNGIGLSAEERERAFERFFQASPSMEGIGVGLSITRTIVNDLGGMIWIDSEGKGRGATATVSLPLQ
jgi:signal transduction histidine kinase